MRESIGLVVRSVLLGAAVVALGVSAGCGSKQKIKTNQVKAKVVFEKGGTAKSLSDAEAAVVFESVDQPGVKATAEILEDGTLTNLITVNESGAEYGLVEGTHRVRLNARQGLVNPKFLSAEKSGITVKVPADEEIVIKVWR